MYIVIILLFKMILFAIIVSLCSLEQLECNVSIAI